MTLYDELIKLAEWLEKDAGEWREVGGREEARSCDAKAAKLRALAERVKDKVLVAAEVCEYEGHLEAVTQCGCLADDWVTGKGETEAEAIANLQAQLDKEAQHE